MNFLGISLLVFTVFATPCFAKEIVIAEVVAELPHAVGNITFSPDNRLIYSLHPFFLPDIRVSEFDLEKKTIHPFPNTVWNTPSQDSENFLDSVLGIHSDPKGNIWMLDMGTRNGITPKLVGWNTNSDQLTGIFRIPEPISRRESQLNDFAIDSVHGAFYIADEGIASGGDGSKAAIVVVNMHTGKSKRLLEGHISVIPETKPIIVSGRVLSVPGTAGDLKPLRIGADGIALDRKAEWLYFGPLNGSWVYRVRTADVLNDSLAASELAKRVERYASKPNNGGLAIDDEGNLYLTEVENKAVGVIHADNRNYERFAIHPKLIWPDGVSFSPEGWMYVSAAQVSEAPIFNNGIDFRKPPYYIFKFKPIANKRLVD